MKSNGTLGRLRYSHAKIHSNSFVTVFDYHSHYRLSPKHFFYVISGGKRLFPTIPDKTGYLLWNRIEKKRKMVFFPIMVVWVVSIVTMTTFFVWLFFVSFFIYIRELLFIRILLQIDDTRLDYSIQFKMCACAFFRAQCACVFVNRQIA